MGQKPFGSIEANPDELWCTGVAEAMCKSCGKLVYHKAVPIFCGWHHLICPYCGATAWVKQEETSQA
jgi:ribosomal protein L37E